MIARINQEKVVEGECPPFVFVLANERDPRKRRNPIHVSPCSATACPFEIVSGWEKRMQHALAMQMAMDSLKQPRRRLP